jgi:hypothetical protein
MKVREKKTKKTKKSNHYFIVFDSYSFLFICFSIFFSFLFFFFLDFDAKVLFSSFLSYLRTSGGDDDGGDASGSSTTNSLKLYCRDYQPTRNSFEYGDTRLLNFSDTMFELFSKSHQHMIGDIKKWANNLPIYPLSDKQHTELEALFELYDADSSGTIDMSELVAHFQKLGFTESGKKEERKGKERKGKERKDKNKK